MHTWPDPRENGLGLVANGYDQVRQQAWSLRVIDEAAWANPTGSVEQTTFAQLASNNWSWLVSQIPTWTQQQGQAYGTLAAIERDLLVDGFLRRYNTHQADDGLKPGEGAFLACSFWLADAYASVGRADDAEKLFKRLLAIRKISGCSPKNTTRRGAG
jgi:hypothetical protein